MDVKIIFLIRDLQKELYISQLQGFITERKKISSMQDKKKYYMDYNKLLNFDTPKLTYIRKNKAFRRIKEITTYISYDIKIKYYL